MSWCTNLFLRYRERKARKIKQFIRLFLMLLFICTMPSFVIADETEPTEPSATSNHASINITKKLLPGAENGTFTFSIKNANTGDVINNNISILTHDATDTTIDTSKIGNYLINDLDPETEYIIELTNVPSKYKYVSIQNEDGSVVITNEKSITIKTGAADSVTEVIATSTFSEGAIANDKSLNPNVGKGTHKISLSVTGSAQTTSKLSHANILVVYDVSGSMTDNYVYVYSESNATSNVYGKVNNSYVSLSRSWYYLDQNNNKVYFDGNYKFAVSTNDYDDNPTKYGFLNGSLIRLYWRNNAFRQSNNSNGTIYNGTVYTASNADGNYDSENEYFGVVNGQMVKLYSGYAYYGGRITGNVVYDGKRYTRKYVSRADAAEKVVYDFAKRLYRNNEGEGNAETVEMALITFSSKDHKPNEQSGGGHGTKDNAAWLDQDWTNDKDDILNKLSSTGDNNSKLLTYGGGTNWEAAMQKALDVLATADGDPTYVIFVTDGAPTFRTTGGSGSGTSAKDFEDVYDEVRKIYNFSTVNGNSNDPSKRNTDIYGIFAFGDISANDNYLDDVIYHAHTGNKRTGNLNTLGQTVATEGYYTATEPEDLDAAIDDIFEKIGKTAGFGNVSISDGTTSQIKVSTNGKIDTLLEVDNDNSNYNYWLTLPVTGDGPYTYKRKNLTTGVDETVTITVNGTTATATWTGGSATLNNVSILTDEDGNIITDSEGRKQLRYKWVANQLYNVSPPAAHYNSATGSVDWELGEAIGTLLNGVTYTVDFDVWPTQYTEDLLADLRNTPSNYAKLPQNVKDYIVDNQNGTFSLRTNTTALITYTDSRDKTGPRTTTFDNPDPVITKQETVSVTKHFENELDPEDDRYNPDKITQISIYLTRDGQIIPDPLLISKDNSWAREIFLSLGNMSIEEKNNIQYAVIRTPGHDYGFAEKDYHWDLTPKLELHPMLINDVVVMLEKTTDKSVNDIGETNILDVGSTRYYKICNTENKCGVYKESNVAESTINIWNRRRSNLNIKKEVIGDYAGDDTFTFEVTINSPEDLWFSISDTNAEDPSKPITGAEVVNLVSGDGVSIEYKTDDDGEFILDDGGNKIPTGYFNIKSGKKITISIKEDWNIRFTNIPLDATFIIKEVVGENSVVFEHMVFEDINSNIIEGSNIVKEGTQISGRIGQSSKIYEILCKNRYLKTIVDVVKEWKDMAGNAITTNVPDSITVKLVSSNGYEEEKELKADSETPWSYTWNGLTKYVWNAITKTYDEITYRVLETKINGKDLPSNKKFDVKDEFNAVIGRWILGDVSGSATDSGMNYSITNIYNEITPKNLGIVKVRFGDNINDPELNGLSGAVFKLYRYLLDDESDDTVLVNDTTPNWKLFATSDGSAKFNFNNLYAGVYRLVEVTSPNGYVLPGGQWKVIVTENEDGTVTIGNPTKIKTPTAITKINDTFYVYNEQVPEIPSTGARGIIDYSLIGLILMTLASFILIVNQKEKI